MVKHICNELKEKISFGKIDSINLINYVIKKDNDDSYYLTKYYYADEKTVLDGEAEKIGEEISKFTMLIDYCPFCGEKLSQT